MAANVGLAILVGVLAKALVGGVMLTVLKAAMELVRVVVVGVTISVLLLAMVVVMLTVRALAVVVV